MSPLQYGNAGYLLMLQAGIEQAGKGCSRTGGTAYMRIVFRIRQQGKYFLRAADTGPAQSAFGNDERFGLFRLKGLQERRIVFLPVVIAG